MREVTDEELDAAYVACVQAEWYEQPGRCGSCLHWREKAALDSTTPPVGICDQPSVRRQVKESGGGFLRSLALEAGASPEAVNEATDWLGVRFGADFGCRHWQDAEGPAEPHQRPNTPPPPTAAANPASGAVAAPGEALDGAAGSARGGERGSR